MRGYTLAQLQSMQIGAPGAAVNVRRRRAPIVIVDWTPHSNHEHEFSAFDRGAKLAGSQRTGTPVGGEAQKRN
jgi:hypothetical protein